MNNTYSILRFKRRQSDDRPETIAVQCKKPKLDGAEVEKSESVIFKYVGKGANESSIELTLKQLESPVRKKRSLTKNQTDDVKNQTLDSKSKHFRSVSVSKKRKVGENIELIEIEGTTPVSDNNEPCALDSDADLMTCNGLKLVRDKLNISEQPSSSTCYNSDGDDLFDLYYHCWSNDVEFQVFDPLDILYVAPLNTLDFMEDSDENTNVDDSDSNDEDNWRNDYPDSSDSCDESADSSLQSDDSLLEKRRTFRHHSWNVDGSIYVSDYDNTQYGFFHDPTDFFDRYSDHVQSDHSLSD